MNPVEELVLEETRCFRAAIPQLMQQYRGRWVVFRGGKMRGDYASADGAYCAALKIFGADGGFVVGQVAEFGPTPVSAGIRFGLP
jgi:hypothetical protein